MPAENDLRNLRALARRGQHAKKTEAELERVRAENEVLKALVAEMRPRVVGYDSVTATADLEVRAAEARAAREAESAYQAKRHAVEVEGRVPAPARERQGFVMRDRNSQNGER